MLTPTTRAISRPKMRKRAVRVQNRVLKTSGKPTAAYHIRSVKKPADVVSAKDPTPRPDAVISSARERRGGGGPCRAGFGRRGSSSNRLLTRRPPGWRPRAGAALAQDRWPP